MTVLYAVLPASPHLTLGSHWITQHMMLMQVHDHGCPMDRHAISSFPERIIALGDAPLLQDFWDAEDAWMRTYAASDFYKGSHWRRSRGCWRSWSWSKMNKLSLRAARNGHLQVLQKLLARWCRLHLWRDHNPTAEQVDSFIPQLPLKQICIAAAEQDQLEVLLWLLHRPVKFCWDANFSPASGRCLLAMLERGCTLESGLRTRVAQLVGAKCALIGLTRWAASLPAIMLEEMDSQMLGVGGNALLVHMARLPLDLVNRIADDMVLLRH